MANGLSVLMGLAKQPGSSGNIPMQSEDDYALDEMIPEEDVYAAQDAIGRSGAASGRAYAVPSRESLRAGGRSALRRLFGEIQAKGAAEAAPHRIQGEYALAQERVKQAGAADIARENRASVADEREIAHQRALERQQIGLNAVMDRTKFSQGQQDKRQQAQVNARRQQQIVADLLRQATEIEKRAKGSWPGWMGGSKDALMQKAAQLRQQAQAGVETMDMGGSGDPDVMELELTPEQLANLQGILGQ